MDFMYPKVWDFLGGEHLEIPSNRNTDPYIAALRLWKELQNHTRDLQSRQRFELSLSEPQIKAWTILDDWWNGRNQEFKPDDNPATVEVLRAEERRQDEHPRDPGNSAYNSALPYLLVVEMVWYAHLGHVSQMPLENMPERMKAIVREIGDKIRLARSQALKSATWQMIANSSLQEITGTGTLSLEKRATSATLEPCPWVGCKAKDSLGKPLYLWDRFRRMTLETSSLPEEDPEYYCISHTWGRWRKQSIRLPQVPWLVPTNTRFDVLSLPETFGGLDWPVRYIWFDLFCIPQEECPQQAEEIGKQAQIFRRARGCVIWMHDVLSWKLLENAILWLGLNYLRRTNPEDRDLRQKFESFTKTLQAESSFLSSSKELLNPWAPVAADRPGDSSSETTHREDPGSRWFSSLWTLQEAYLCPSALLADRNWKFLGVGERLMLSLDGLASLAYSPASALGDNTTRPDIVEVLMFTIKRWELSDLTSPSRMSLLIAAESRVSTGPRAEAIMSAVGVTDWFESYRLRHGQGPPQTNLVFGLYPLQFLIEAQHKLGGAFFLHHRAPQPTVDDAKLGEPLGTMLPLAHNRRYWQVSQAMTMTTSNWSSSWSDGWEIQVDGSVVIKDAAILASVASQPVTGADGPISVSSPNGYQRFDSFSAWAKELPDVPFCFAVAVVRYSHRQFGIILEGVAQDLSESSLVLVKTGIFMTEERWCREDLINPCSVPIDLGWLYGGHDAYHLRVSILPTGSLWTGGTSEILK